MTAAPDPLNLARQKRRLTAMFAIKAVCMVLAACAVFVAIRYHVSWLWGAFIVLLIAGFGSHIWFILGFARAGKSDAG